MVIVGLKGTLTNGNISLASASVAGQVIALTGSFSDGTLTGTYVISGGCAEGDHGSITGSAIPYIANMLNGTFTTSEG